MSYLEIILISIGLAMDCFAVSFSAGATQPELRLKNTLIVGLFFGFFQASMAAAGWLCGEAIVEKISRIDHWITFIILAFIGGKMIFEAFHEKKQSEKINVMRIPTLLILSIATSIDALAAGFGFAMMEIHNIYIVILFVGVFSFTFSILGIYGGKKLHRIIKPAYAELLGGAILVIIGLKILLEHLLA